MVQACSTRPRIVVIGGGFSGAALALHLARTARHAVEIVVIEPRAALGRGIAYSAIAPFHRVNIASRRMVLLPEDPEDFDRWLEAIRAPEHDPEGLQAGGHFFPSRKLFGDYVGERLAAAIEDNPLVQFRHIRDRAAAIQASNVVTAEAGSLAADAIVVATGNPPTRWMPPLADLSGHAALIDACWEPDALDGIGLDDRILIVGTGLSMGDAVASLAARGHNGAIVALSRHGLLPLRRRPRPYQPAGDFLHPPAKSALALSQRVRQAVRAAEPAGWEAVIDAVRNEGQAIWQSLDTAEQRRFLRHLRPYWDIHRHQIAPPIDDRIQAMRRRGQLQLVAARLTAADTCSNQIAVRWRRRGRREEDAPETFDRIVNCSGPGAVAMTQTNSLLASLVSQKRARLDPNGLSLAVDDASRPDGVGASSPPIFLLGAPARGHFGELTGVRELAMQAEAVASRIDAMLRERR